jgi:8-oxo-dGTP diphosphatase
MGDIMVAVGAVIEDDKGRILLVRHVPEREGFWKGKWICPGGRLDTGESIRDGIEREVMEETNLKIHLTTPLVPFERIVKADNETVLHVIYIDFLAKLAGGELRVDSDVGEAMWVAREDIPKVWEDLHEDTQRLMGIAGVV